MDPTDLVVSRVQVRRGKRYRLPQPLKEGEFGFAEDTEQVFIGGNPNEGDPGVEIFTGIVNGVQQLQNVLDNNLIKIYLEAGFDEDNFFEFQSIVSADNNVSWDGSLVIFVSIPDGEESAIISNLNTYNTENPGKIDMDESTDSGTEFQLSDIGVDLQIINDSLIQLDSHEQAFSVAKVINFLVPIGLVTSTLNIEVTAPKNKQPILDALYNNPKEFTLPPNASYPDFEPLTNNGLEFDITKSDSVILDFSVTAESGSENHRTVGSMTIVGSTAQGDATLSEDAVVLEDGTSGTIDFTAEYSPTGGSGGGKIIVKYRHDFNNDAELRIVNMRRWRSF